MKNNSQGILALTDGLIDGGCRQVNGYPGSGSQYFFEKLGGRNISQNEKVAFEQAYGSSMAGNRTVIAMKSVGLNACADPFLHAVINGIHAGLVLILVDDVEAVSSPERQDSRFYRNFFGGLWLEPNSSQMAYDFGYDAFELSEKFDVPIVIRVTNQFFELTDLYSRKIKKSKDFGIVNTRSKYISYWLPRYKNLIKKNKEIESRIDSLYAHNVVSGTQEVGYIVAGACQKEIQQNNVDLSKQDVFYLNTYPLPKRSLEKFLDKKKKVFVFEQGEGFVINDLKSKFCDKKIEWYSCTGHYGDNSKSWKPYKDANKLFAGLKQANPAIVVGDEGQFTDEDQGVIQVCLSMGSSVGIAMGVSMSLNVFPFCVIGDVSFAHGGKQSLEEAVQRNLALGIIVIDNGGAKSTGGQKPILDIYDIDEKIDKKRILYNETSIEDFKKMFLKAKATGKLCVIYVKID